MGVSLNLSFSLASKDQMPFELLNNNGTKVAAWLPVLIADMTSADLAGIQRLFGGTSIGTSWLSLSCGGKANAK